MFPVTDKSKSIVDALFNRINELGVTVFTKTQVTKLLRKDDQIIGVETELEKIYAPCVVLTTGGRTYPSTGATGDGYKLAKKWGIPSARSTLPNHLLFLKNLLSLIKRCKVSLYKMLI